MGGHGRSWEVMGGHGTSCEVMGGHGSHEICLEQVFLYRAASTSKRHTGVVVVWGNGECFLSVRAPRGCGINTNTVRVRQKLVPVLVPLSLAAASGFKCAGMDATRPFRVAFGCETLHRRLYRNCVACVDAQCEGRSEFRPYRTRSAHRCRSTCSFGHLVSTRVIGEEPAPERA